MKDLLTKNISLKLTAFTLAILLELYFYSPENLVVAEISVPVDIRNLPANKMVIEPEEAQKGIFAKVRIRGPRPLIDQIKGQTHSFQIDFPEGAKSKFSGLLNPQTLGLPSAVEILTVSPAKIDFGLERLVKKRLLVVLDRVGKPAAGYRLQEVKVIPETVFAQGPRSELEGVGLIQTEEVDLSGFTENKRLEVSLIDKGPHTNLEVNVVTVEVLVRPLESQKSFDKVNVQVLAPKGFAATVEPSRAQVRVRGPQVVLRKMKKTDITLFADVQTLTDGRHNVRLTGKFPKGVGMVRTIPERVRVNIVTTNGRESE